MHSEYIAIIKYPGVQLTAVHGLTDMLITANAFISKSKLKQASRFCVSHWELDVENNALEATFKSLSKIPYQQTVCILPGSLENSMTEPQSVLIQSWIRQQHYGGAIASSVCKGAFILAGSGLVDNRIITTHWDLASTFKTEFPKVHLDIEKILISDGDIITAGGVMAWLDLGLNIIHRFSGPEIMIAVAKYFLIDVSGREQKFYSPFAPPLDHGDVLILKLQHFLQQNYHTSHSLKSLAEISSVSTRTLIRRFQKILGMSPTRYIQALRIGKAKELLEFTTLPVNHIALSVGYEDPGAFRKIFRRISGSTPIEHRQRFKVPSSTRATSR